MWILWYSLLYPAVIFKTEIAGASYLCDFSFSVKSGWKWSISSKVTEKSSQRCTNTHLYIDYIGLFTQVKNRKPIKYTKTTLKDEGLGLGWKEAFVSPLQYYPSVFGCLGSACWWVQGNPPALAVVSLMWTPGSCTMTPFQKGLGQGCNSCLWGGKAVSPALVSNIYILISQITTELRLNQDSDQNFCENLDQNHHGRAHWEPPALGLWWHACKGLSVFRYRTFPRTKNPLSCKAPNPSLLMKMMHPDVPQWNMDYPSKNHRVSLANSNFWQECGLLVFV